MIPGTATKLVGSQNYLFGSEAVQIRPWLANKEYVPLTVESLLTFCQTRLRDLDEQIAARMLAQKARVDLGEVVGALKQFTAKQMPVAVDKDGVKDPDPAAQEAGRKTVDEGNKLFDASIAKAREVGDYEAVRALTDMKATWNMGNDGSVTSKELEGINKALDVTLGDLSKSNELEMIELQSLISKRSTALQLTTNMMNGLNEAQKTITGNVGR